MYYSRNMLYSCYVPGFLISRRWYLHREKNNLFALTFVYLGCSTRLLWARKMSNEECLYTVVTNMLFVVHNVSYERYVLKVGEKMFCHWHVDGISAIFLYLCLNWKWVDPKRKIKFSLSHTWKSLFVYRPVWLVIPTRWTMHYMGNWFSFHPPDILHFK